MPQLNPEFFATQIFWLMVCFATLLAFIALVIVPAMSRINQQRRELVIKRVKEAENLRKGALEINAEIENKLGEARVHCENLVKEAELRAAAFRQKTLEEVDKALKEEVGIALKEIESFKERSLQVNDELAGQIAKQLVHKIYT
jgi:F-type H+-transporting ATPase subunit b